MSRWIRFFLAIALGVAAGLAYAWIVNPVEYVNTTPDTLRPDFKTDYVLMVAEVYRAEGDLAIANRSLGMLGDQKPLVMVQDAVIYASEKDYGQVDVDLLQALLIAFQTWNPSPQELRAP